MMGQEKAQQDHPIRSKFLRPRESILPVNLGIAM
jgi:hypothetical protein